MVAVAVAVAVAALVSAPIGVNAYANTVPLIAWSSKQSIALDALPSNPSHAVPLLEEILVNDDACDFGAVVIAHQPGLHASDLRTLSPGSPLATVLRHAPSQRQFQYLSTKNNNYEDVDLSSISEGLAARCGSHPSAVLMPEIEMGLAVHDGKAVIRVEMSSLDGGLGMGRKEQVAWDSASLIEIVDLLLEADRSVLVVYTGTRPDESSGLYARRELDSHTAPALADIIESNTSSFKSSFAAKNKKGGILHHYQLLTPGLILALLVVLFILLPVPILGFRALASIQSPSSKAGTGFNATEKKNQ